jgi:hypothetical protein
MTTLSYSQQQLLKVLQISPVKLTDAFSTQPLLTAASSLTHREPSPSPASENIAPDITIQFLAPELSQKLAQDIVAALADGLNWQIDPDAAQSQIQQQQLLTPALPVLQQAEQKKALWALLSSYVQGSYAQGSYEQS